MLACGPMFSEIGMGTSLIVLLIVKPITYFAFIQAYRYRVSAHIPMTYGRAAGLALIRALVGVAIIGGSAWAIVGSGDGGALAFAWPVLILERLAVWLAIGYGLARLRGHRLAGWTLGGCAIDVAYDISIAFALFEALWAHAAVAAGAGIWIFFLTKAGRRLELRGRFRGCRCGGCGYDLTGNLSGICPECGMPVPGPTAWRAE